MENLVVRGDKLEYVLKKDNYDYLGGKRSNGVYQKIIHEDDLIYLFSIPSPKNTYISHLIGKDIHSAFSLWNTSKDKKDFERLYKSLTGKDL